MKKCKILVTSLVVLLVAVMLGGCSIEEIYTPTTSHELTLSESNNSKFSVSLKANLEQGYKWYIYCDVELDQTDHSQHEGFINHTLSESYEYYARTTGDFNYYLILVKDGDLEGAKVYPYEMNLSTSAILTYTEKSSFDLSTNKRLLKTLKENLTITTD